MFVLVLRSLVKDRSAAPAPHPSGFGQQQVPGLVLLSQGFQNGLTTISCEGETKKLGGVNNVRRQMAKVLSELGRGV